MATFGQSTTTIDVLTTTITVVFGTTLPTFSDLVPTGPSLTFSTVPSVISATATPASTDGTTSVLPSISALPLTLTSVTSTPTFTLTSTPTFTPTTSSSGSPTLIPQTLTTSSIIPSNLNIPIISTSTPLLQSTSNSVSAAISSIVTTIATVVDGSSTTMTLSLPTTLVDSSSAEAISRRTAAIAGATTSFALVLMALGAVILYRRHKLRKALESSGKKKEGRALLDGEEFNDDVRNVSTTMQSHPYLTHASHPEATSTPNSIKSRTSDTGSMFREEVWPPPGFIDPISKQSSLVDLSGIVDDVMGASSSGHTGPSAGDRTSRQPINTRTLSATSSASSLSLYSETSEPSPSTFESRIPTSSSMISLPTSARVSSNTQPRTSSPLARASITDSKLWLTRNVRQMSSTK